MAEPAPRRRFIRVVPNTLSVLRLVLAAAFPFAPPSWRLGLVIAGGLSDWMDGAIARRFEAKTAAGQLLDGIADKLFVVSVLVTIGLAGLLTWWQILLVITRDLSVAYVAAHMTLRRDWALFRRLVPRLPGKLTTGLQFALFAAVLLWPDTLVAKLVLAAAVACSLTAALDYLSLYVRGLREP